MLLFRQKLVKKRNMRITWKIALILFIGLLPFNDLLAQTEMKYTLTELKDLLKTSKTPQDKIRYSNRLSYFYINNKFQSEANIDTALSYANKALEMNGNDRNGVLLGESQLALVQARLRKDDPKKILKEMLPNRPEIRIRMLIEVAAFYVYKPREEKADLDNALSLLNRAIQLARSSSLPKLEHLAEYFICDIFREKAENVKAKLAYTNLIEKSRLSGDWDNAGAASSRYAYHLPLGEEKLQFFQRAADFYKAGKNIQGYIEEKKNIADAQLNMGRLAESEKGLTAVLEMYRAGGYKNLQFTYDLLSVVYRLEGKLKESLSSALSALKYMDITGSDASRGYFLNNLGSIYAELGNTKQSVIAYQKALDAVQYENREVKLTSLKLLTDGLIKEGHIKEVLSLADINDSGNQLPVAKLIFATIRGNAYNASKKYDLAEQYYLKMVDLEPTMQSAPFNMAESFYTIAQFYAQRKEFKKSRYYFNKVLALPKGLTPLSSVRNIYYNLYQADSAHNDLSSAIDHYKIYKKLNDSLNNARSNHDMQELLIQYEATKKEKDNELLRKESALQKNKLQRAEWLTKVTVMGLIALLAIIGLSLYGFGKRQKANRLLKSHQQEIELKNASLQSLIDKQAKLLVEKEWLIKEIHHRIKNNLQVITSLLNAQGSYLRNDAALSAIRDSQNRIHSISLIHQKLFQSENVSLINIKSYTEELLRFLCDTFHVEQKISFVVDVPEYEMDIVQAMPLGLIINEAITNTIKYAFPAGNPGIVTLSLADEGNGYYLFRIGDNGVGLQAEDDLSNSSSLGMTLIRGLGDQLGGETEISSVEGVQISIRFPVVMSPEV
jgi:two-component sensor histidine kinase